MTTKTAKTKKTVTEQQVTIVDADGKKAGTATLPAELFGARVNVPLIHQVVVAQQAAARQGTHKVKRRGEVSGGGAKPYRQKGTGRARQGSIRAPQFTGGGVVHGPVPRDYSQRTPKKMKAAALRSALSDRAAHQRVHIISDLIGGDAPSTKRARLALERITTNSRVLLVVTEGDELTALSARNLPQVHLILADQLNTYDVMVADDVIFTQPAFEYFVAMGQGAAVGHGMDTAADVEETV